MDDYKQRLLEWGFKYEYRVPEMVARFDEYERTQKENELIAKQINLLGKEGNAEDLV